MKHFILVECKPDFELANFLKSPKGLEVIHTGNKSGICVKLIKTTNLLGLMDEDPVSHQPTYFNELQEEKNAYGVKIFLDKKRNHKVIVLSPRLEGWIIKRAKNNKLDLEQFGLFNNESELLRHLNQRLPNFKRLLEKLSELNDQGLAFLKKSVREYV